MELRTLLIDNIAPLRDLSDRTVTMYGQSIDRFRDYLGREPTLDDLDDLTMSKFLKWRASTVHDKKRGLISRASLAKDSAHLCSIWGWAAKKRMHKSNGKMLEFADFKKPTAPTPRPVAYTAEDLQRLVSAARHRKGTIDGVPAAWYWTTKLMALFETGERIGAVMAIRWREADLERRTLTFLAQTRKGRRETITRAITPELAELMAAQRRSPEQLVWPWLEDRDKNSIYGSLKTLCRTAGVAYHPFHSIRKSTASYLKKAGVSAKHQLGHASEEMAERHYYDSSIVGVESALDYLPRLDGGPGKPR